MKKVIKVIAIALVGFVIPLLAVAGEGPQPNGNSLWVARDMVTTQIIDREPIEDGAAFSPSMGPVYYFTEVKELTHRPTLPIFGTTKGGRWRRSPSLSTVHGGGRGVATKSSGSGSDRGA